MKPPRHNKVLGLSVGDASMLLAELSGNERPEVKRVAEFVYPAGLSLQTPAELGKALAAFLDQNDFGAKHAAVGLPARWLVIKPKEVPPADSSTLSELLRLQAEGDFSSELKDLVYDYTASSATDQGGTVLLVATARNSIQSVVDTCEAARLNVAVVTSAAVALSTTIAQAGQENAVVLSITGNGAELTANRGAAPAGIRHLRVPASGKAFTGELRRALSGLPLNGVHRTMVLWNDGKVPAPADLNIEVRPGRLADLGVASSIDEAQAAPYAGAIAVALSAMVNRAPEIDFLHSRLAAPKRSHIPRWAYLAAAALIAIVVLAVMSFNNLAAKEKNVADLEAKVKAIQPELKTAEVFVSKVNFAKGWQNTDPRYLACLRDLTAAFPEDSPTIATNLTLKDVPRPQASATATKTTFNNNLTGTVVGKTTDQQQAQNIVERIKKAPGFADVKLGYTQEAARGREVSFSITFTYRPTAPEAK